MRLLGRPQPSVPALARFDKVPTGDHGPSGATVFVLPGPAQLREAWCWGKYLSA